MGTGNSDYRIGPPSHDYYQDLIVTKGSRERNYLQVKHRLQLLRDCFPEAKITTTVLQIDTERQFAAFHARVELPNGAVGEGTGSETAADFRDYIEKAETKAIGRACSAAGIGHQYGIADMEYEAESPKDYVGVDTGIAPNRPRSEAQPAARPPQAQAQAGETEAEQQASRERAKARSIELLEHNERIGVETVKEKFAEMFGADKNWRQLEEPQQVEFLEWARAQQSAG